MGLKKAHKSDKQDLDRVMRNRGGIKHRCDDYGGYSWFFQYELVRASRLRCVNCGSTWIEPCESIKTGLADIREHKKSVNKRLNEGG